MNTMEPLELKRIVWETFLNNKKTLLAEEQAFFKSRMEEANRSDADDPQDRASEASDELFREVENQRASLDALAEEIEVLERQNIHEPEALVSLGALVQTDHGWYYVAVSHAPIKVGDVAVVGVSQHSPWYQAARTLPVGGTFVVNGVTFQVMGLY